ncbi:MAG: 30S ribosomal protein S6, partial [Candidatus Caldatribacterium sp.]|nr:30S ribosomal protein S6 [Candidatus Caldatribacterium sp.]
VVQGGMVHGVDFWGKRRLAYPIDKQKEGYYVFLRFSLSPRNVAEVSRIARYTEDILRHILVKAEKKPEDPVAVQASDATTYPE